MTIRARIALPAVALAAALAVSACGASSTSPGAAAIVGDTRISVAQLQTIVNRALANPQAQQQVGANRAGFTRDELSRLIDNQIIASAAAAHGVTVSSNDVDQQLAQFAQQVGGMAQLEQAAAQQGIPKQDLRTFTRYYVMQQKLADKLVADQLPAAYQQNIDQFVQVHAAHILVKTKALADKILAEVKADPTRFAADAAKYSIDTGSKNTGGDLGFASRDKFVKPFADAIFSAKPGSYLEVHSQFGWHVVHVIARRTLSLAEATPQLNATVLKDARTKALQQVLVAEAKKLHVHVNPRYGRWDATKAQVVPIDESKNGVSSPSPSSGGSSG